MHAKSIRVKTEDRSSAKNYLCKAEDNYDAMVGAFR